MSKSRRTRLSSCWARPSTVGRTTFACEGLHRSRPRTTPSIPRNTEMVEGLSLFQGKNWIDRHKLLVKALGLETSRNPSEPSHTKHTISALLSVDACGSLRGSERRSVEGELASRSREAMTLQLSYSAGAVLEAETPRCPCSAMKRCTRRSILTRCRIS